MTDHVHNCRVCGRSTGHRQANARYCGGVCYRRAQSLGTRYGLSPEEYNRMLVAQDGRCAICLQAMAHPRVDHDHRSETVRGLLCHGCNLLVGFLETNNKRVVRAALDYIRETTPI